MNTKQFQYVLTLAHEGSFSKAADSLRITQPSLSQYIKKIEQEVGAELFARVNGDVRITDAGRIYIEAGRKILDIEHQMKNALIDIAEQKTGSLIIGTSPFRAVSMMPEVAAWFKKKHPKMQLIVREMTTAELLDGVEHGDFDFAVTLLPVDERRFSFEQLAKEEIVLAVPASSAPFPSTIMEDRKKPAVSVAVLQEQQLVMLTETQFMQKQMEDILYDAGVKPITAAVVKSLQAQIEMVRAGVGMAVVPSGIERFCHDDAVRFYSFSEPVPSRQPGVIWRKNEKLSGIAEELITVLRKIQW